MGKQYLPSNVSSQSAQRCFAPGQETSLQTFFASFLNCHFSGWCWRLFVSAVGNSVLVNVLLHLSFFINCYFATYLVQNFQNWIKHCNEDCKFLTLKWSQVIPPIISMAIDCIYFPYVIPNDIRNIIIAFSSRPEKTYIKLFLFHNSGIKV